MQDSFGSLWETLYHSQVITMIGAGGKTTALVRLIQELSAHGTKVIATTTTKVYPIDCATIWVDVIPPPDDIRYPCFWYKEESNDGKWIGPDTEKVEEAIDYDKNHNNNRVWIIEGDGARSLYLKCWAGHEPQIPSNTDCVVLIISAGLWGKTLHSKDVHRPEYCKDLIDRTWNTQTFWNYLQYSPVCRLKLKNTSWVVLFNETSCSGQNILNQVKLLESDKKNAVLGDRAFPRFAVGNVKEGLIRWLDL
ncbi:MAG: hypothetical protein APF84_11110 [Gracilibacter sp. BRH_c7a]|nr:MAG: hypothetical protein APF84_11110 [Gracilibacter sp. BRH_c7a]